MELINSIKITIINRSDHRFPHRASPEVPRLHFDQSFYLCLPRSQLRAKSMKKYGKRQENSHLEHRTSNKPCRL